MFQEGVVVVVVVAVIVIVIVFEIKHKTRWFWVGGAVPLFLKARNGKRFLREGVTTVWFVSLGYNWLLPEFKLCYLKGRVPFR